MWRLVVALIAAIAIAPWVRASSVGLIWTGSSSPHINGLSTGTADVDQTIGPVTLTLDIVLTADAAGVSALAIDLSFDDDGRNELDLVSWSELGWSSGDGSRSLNPATPGIEFVRESEPSGPSGLLIGFEGMTVGLGPANVSFSFARAVFATSQGRAAPPDGFDIFGTARGALDNSGQPIDLAVAPASVNALPEPGTLALVAGGFLAIGAVRRTRAVRVAGARDRLR